MENLSILESEVYNFIKEEKEVEFKQIKEKFGNKGIGTVGKLNQRELIEIHREYTGKRRKLIKLKEQK